MGLDILVCKPKNAVETPDEDDEYSLFDHPELKIWENLSYEKEMTYVDWKKSFSDLGLNDEDYEWCSSGGVTDDWERHEQDVRVALKIDDWATTRQHLDSVLKTNDWATVKEHFILASTPNEWETVKQHLDWNLFDTYVTFKNKISGEKLVFKEKSLPIYSRIEKIIFCEEIGYQRKGANKQFFTDKIWDSPAIVDLKTLNEIGEKYFSHDENFKENIIDKFVEGETFVLFT